jgi:spore coat protein U-like protein
LGGLATAVAPNSAAACTITATAVSFGGYDPRAAGADDGIGSIALQCAPSVSAPVVALGAGSSGAIAARTMRNGPTLLGYNIYSDAARTILWGNGASGSAITLTGGTVSGGQRNFSHAIYGRIPAGQNVRAGSYGDTLVITVTF